MLRKAASGIAWVGRTASMVFGLAVVLALLFGAASVALAGTGVGARFDLGKINKVNAVSTLIGSVSGPTLALQNDRSDRAATALSLQMGNPNLAPMRTNSSATVGNLSADSVDGRDAGSFADGTGGKADDADMLDGKDSTAFFSGKAYIKLSPDTTVPENGEARIDVECDIGDFAMSGGHLTINDSGSIRVKSQFIEQDLRTYDLRLVNDDPIRFGTVQARVTCADFPPLRP